MPHPMLRRVMRAVRVLPALLVGFLSGCGYNQFQTLDEQTKSAWSEVVNQYQRRADLIPNLVETVKGYATHEKETLQAVTDARSRIGQVTLKPGDLGDAAKMQQFQDAQGGLSGALSRLLVVAENYPDLKSNQQFKLIMLRCGTKDHLLDASDATWLSAQRQHLEQGGGGTIICHIVNVRDGAVFTAGLVDLSA